MNDALHIKIITSETQETFEFGKRLAQLVRPGDIILLQGPLGAGKTVFVRGFVSGIDEKVASLVTSQSYIIAVDYPTDPPIHHLDLYRLSTIEEVLGLGYEEMILSDDGIALIEWPQLAKPLIQQECDQGLASSIEITFQMTENPDERVIDATATDDRIFQALEKASQR